VLASGVKISQKHSGQRNCCNEHEKTKWIIVKYVQKKTVIAEKLIYCNTKGKPWRTVLQDQSIK